MPEPSSRRPPLPPLDRSERAWTVGIGVAAAIAFVTTMSSSVALGDAPESVAGIASLGILHAPGYPVYVVAARLFSLAVPVGALSFRANLFSLTCAVLTVVCVFRIARDFGASRPGAALGGLTLALGTAFWFYAGFAKHDAFSALLVVIAILLVVEWDHRRDLRLLVAAGGVLGVSLGSSWQLGALVLPGIAMLVALNRGNRPISRVLGPPVIAGLIAAAAVLGFLVLRAGQSPAINWGDARTPGRIVDLLAMKDFSFVSRHVALASHRSGRGESGASLPRRLANYPTLLAREMGIPALLVAGWGAALSRRRLAARHAAFLGTHFFVGVLGTAAFVGPGSLTGFTTNLIVGGFLTSIFCIVAIWVALGATDLTDAISARLGGHLPSPPTHRNARDQRVQRRALPRRPKPAVPLSPRRAPAVIGVVVIVALVSLLLIPSSLVHWRHASHRQPPFADDYAANVFRTLPSHAAILTRGGELTFALLYRQVAFGERPDVTVIAADSLAGSSWYRGQLSRKVRISLPDIASQGAELVAVVHALQRHEPVYMDMLTTDALRPALGYVARGLVSEIVDGVGPKLPNSTLDIERLLDQQYRTQGVYSGAARRRWPNTFLLSSYVRAHLELARDYNSLGQLNGVLTQARMALEVDPTDKTAKNVLKAVTDALAKAQSSG